MDNTILTRNVFIAAAFQQIMDEYRCENICIVDIDSYRSLNEVLQVMKGANLNLNQQVYFLKGISIFSKILVSITAFHVLDSPLHIKRVILAGRAPRYAVVAKYIRTYRKLSMMTHKEKQIAQALVRYQDVSSMAHALNANHKTIYSRVRVMAIKLNLRNIGQVRKFIISEAASARGTS